MLYEAVFGLKMLRQLFILLIFHFNSYSMKKSILAGIALLGLTATSYAQNSSTVIQNGTSQTAVAGQTGNGQVSTISQVQSATATGSTTNFGNFGATSQTGTTSNTATVNQNNGSRGNRAYATQLGGNGNKATINQNDNSGGGTTAATETAGGGDGNTAGTYQTGSNNTAGVNQNNVSQRNLGEVRQNGTTNFGTVNQSNTSKDNVGQVYQGFANNTALQPLTGVTSNTATIFQGKTNSTDATNPGQSAGALSNTATITQLSDVNSATIKQGATTNVYTGAGAAGQSIGSTATILQDVSAGGHTATIFQGTEGAQSATDAATITQAGSANIGQIIQGLGSSGTAIGISMNNVATIKQAGTASTALVTQGQIGVATGSMATINQTSTSNGGTVYIFQGFGGFDSSTGDKAGVTQGGAAGAGDNYVQITQGGASGVVGGAVSSGNSATVTQGDGTSNNEAIIDQGVNGGTATNNKASIDQKGTINNAVRIVQGRAFTLTDGSGASITTGLVSTGSSATVTQDGSSNTGKIYQADGTNGTGGHMATLMQTGSTNSALLYQEGTAQKATIKQMGDNNTLDGGMTGSVATQMGDTNTATVMQTSAMGSAGNMAHLMQAGSGNNAMITQSATAMPN